MIKNLTKEDLEKLYHSKTNKDVCFELGITLPTLMKYIRKAGIKQKPQGNFDNSDKIKLKIINND
tara:strand:+ start:2063 stop:2257 length:195 start_codon:yes stop_codon:yes gene_type:complete